MRFAQALDVGRGKAIEPPQVALWGQERGNATSKVGIPKGAIHYRSPKEVSALLQTSGSKDQNHLQFTIKLVLMAQEVALGLSQLA